MLFTSWEVHIGRNCAWGLEYQDLRHSFSQYGLTHRPQCYCLSWHVLAEPMHGIVIVSIKLSDFRLLSSMDRRLLIKRCDVWSKSEGEIKLTKALSFKRGLRSSQDFCQQSRLQRHSLSFFVDMPHSQWFERGSRKFSHKKILLLKCGKSGAVESPVRETLASILSLSSFTRPAKTFHQTPYVLLDRFT